MKKQIFKYSLTFAAFFLLYACTKSDGVTNQPYMAYGTGGTQGQLKINFASAYLSNPSVLLKLNGSVVSSSITARTPFPGGGYNTNGSNFALYLAVPQGTNTVSVVRPKVGTNVDSIVLYSTNISIPDNAAYTLHIADTMVDGTTNNTKSLLVQNQIGTVDTGCLLYTSDAADE